LADGDYTLEATATIKGKTVSGSISVTVTNDLPNTGTVGPAGGTLKSGEGSYATLPAGALPGNATLSLEDTTQQQILDDFGVDYTALGVTFLGALTVDATGTPTERSQTPVQVDLAGWAAAVKPLEDVVMFNVLPDQNGDGIGELTFAAQAQATADGSVVTRPTPRAEVYGFGDGNGSLRRQQASSARPGELIELQGRGLTPHSVLGNTASFASDEVVLVTPTDLEEDAFNPLQSILMAVPALGQGNHDLTLGNGSTGFESDSLTLQIGSLGSGSQATWDAFVAQLDAAIAGITDGNDALFTLAGSYLASLASDATLQAMVANSGLVSSGNLALLQGIATGSYSDSQRELVARHALLLDALAVSNPTLATSAADLASLLMVASPSSDGSSLASIRGQQAGGGGCSGPSAPIFWGSPTGMGGAPAGACGGGGSGGGGGGGSPLRTQRLGSYGPVEGAFIRFLMPDGVTPLSPFTTVTDEAGQFFVPFLPSNEPFVIRAIDPASGDTAEAQGVAGAVGELSLVSLAFAPNLGGPGDPVASFSFSDQGDGLFSFDATASIDPDGEIVEYLWDFGDGSPPDFYWDTAEWDYLYAGSYTVTLTVFDDMGNAGIARRTLPTLAPIYDVELVADNALDAAIDQTGNLVGYADWTDSSFSTSAGVVLKDMTSGNETRVDTAADGTPANDWSGAPDIGGDGRYVMFRTGATNLSTDPVEHYLKDLQTGDIVPIGNDLVGQTSGCVARFSLSSDGRHLGLLWSSGCGTSSFSSLSAYLYDLDTDTLTHLNTLADGSPASPQKARTVIVDADGSVALFSHDDANLVPGDDNGWTDTFRKDLDTGAVERVTLRSNGEQIGDFLSWPLDGSLSDDGRYFLFATRDGQVVNSDGNDALDVFLHDLDSGDISRVSTRSDGSELPGGHRGPEAVISGDGRYALFIASVDELDDPSAVGGESALVVKDLASGEIAWLNRTDLGKSASNQRLDSFDISSDGRWIVFEEFRLTLDATYDSLGIYRVENPLWEAAP
jgi:Tol biopolymer transport system component